MHRHPLKLNAFTIPLNMELCLWANCKFEISFPRNSPPPTRLLSRWLFIYFNFPLAARFPGLLTESVRGCDGIAFMELGTADNYTGPTLIIKSLQWFTISVTTFSSLMVPTVDCFPLE